MHLHKDKTTICSLTNIHLQEWSSSSSVNHSSLPFFDGGGLDFEFQNYFQLAVRCIACTCAWHNDTVSPVNIIQPKLQLFWLWTMDRMCHLLSSTADSGGFPGVRESDKKRVSTVQMKHQNRSSR